MASEVCMDKGMCKGWTVRSPGSAKCKPKKRTINYGICVLNAHMVLEGSMSAFFSTNSASCWRVWSNINVYWMGILLAVWTWWSWL